MNKYRVYRIYYAFLQNLKYDLYFSRRISKIEKWEKKSFDQQRNLCLSFGNNEWHNFNDDDNGRNLLTFKICYAIYGPPKNMNEKVSLKKRYNEGEQEQGDKIKDAILKEIRESNTESIKIGFIFINYMNNNEEFTHPVFRVRK